MIALDPNSAYPYVLKREQEDAAATTWLLKFLTGAELRLLQTVVTQLQSAEDMDPATVDSIVAFVLRGWRRLPDNMGVEMPTPPREDASVCGATLSVIPAAVLARIPLSMHDKGELIGEVVRAAQLGIEDAKK